MIRALAAVLVASLLPASAAAQGAAQHELSGGYAYVEDPKNRISLPAGWMAGGAIRLTDWISAVAEVSAHGKTTPVPGSEVRLRLLGFTGGLRASARIGRLTQFVQLLAGVARSEGSAYGMTTSSRALALQPGVGVDYPSGSRLAARAELDVRFLQSRSQGAEGGYQYRFVAALVYRVR